MRPRIKRWSGAILLAILAAMVVAYASLAHMRATAIHEISVNAGATDGDAVEALIAYLESGATPMKERNRTIWALGELRDARALPALEALATGDECDHERYVCQREVTKAVRKITGEIPNPYL